MKKQRTVVLAITGASGVVYAVRLLEVLRAAGCCVHLSISPSAKLVLKQELGLTIDLDRFSLESLSLTSGKPLDTKLDMLRSMAGISSQESNVLSIESGEPGKIFYHHYQDLMAPLAEPVPDARHGDLPVLRQHPGSRGSRPGRQFDSSGGSSAS